MIEGFYYDPKHGMCLRKITLMQDNTLGAYKITGAYGNDEPNTGTKWTAKVLKTKKKNVYYVDFSDKKHATHGGYMVTYDPNKRTLNWEDGNVWNQMYHWYESIQN